MTRLTLPIIAALALAACNTGSDTSKTGDSNGNQQVVDEDADGYTTDQGDCDDTDPTVNPGAAEACDGVDNNCDGSIDEGLQGTYYQDADGDTYGDDASMFDGCDPGEGWSEVGGDCDDAEAAINPGAEEICDGVDNDCNGDIDEGLLGTFYEDTDGDTYGDPATETTGCDPGMGWVTVADDCDDTDQHVNPGATELCNGVDDNCDGSTDEGLTSPFYADTDGDNYGDHGTMEMLCEATDGWVVDSTDCDDTAAAVNPGATEICNGIDDDCDHNIDEGVTSTFYADSDGDTYGDPSTGVDACEAPGAGWVTNPGDCNDTEALAWTGATEVCDGVDNNCDGAVDEGVTTTYYRDGDGDTYGDPSVSTAACTDPGDAWVTNSGDCNDTEPLAWTGAAEVCDSVDNDCDGRIDEDVTSTWYADADGDSYGDPGTPYSGCAAISGYVTNDGDCNDREPLAWTGADELCDSVDNDCDGSVDEDAIDGMEYPSDEDGDGFGSATATTMACSGVSNTLDCDDSSASEPKVVDLTSTAATPDGTSTYPYLTIQDGIDNALECVVVYPGTYAEDVDFHGADVLVESVEGPTSTIIYHDGSASTGSVVTFASGETSAAELSGFTISGGNGTFEEVDSSGGCASAETCTAQDFFYYGGGIYVDGASPTLSDLVVTGNVLPGYNVVIPDYSHIQTTYSYGGGIFVNNGSPTASEVTVVTNTANVGGGAYVGDSGTFSYKAGRAIYNSAYQDGGGFASNGSLTVKNTVVVGNVAGENGGGTAVESGTSTFENTTSVANSATSGGGFAAIGTAMLTLTNSIVVGSPAGDGVYFDASAGGTLMYNNVYGNSASNYSGVTDPTGTSGNISSDPMFVNYTDNATDDDDFHLQSGSPSVDAGNPAAAYRDADTTTNDQGAYGGSGSDW